MCRRRGGRGISIGMSEVVGCRRVGEWVYEGQQRRIDSKEGNTTSAKREYNKGKRSKRMKEGSIMRERGCGSGSRC